MAARRFLLFIVGAIVLVALAGVGYTLFQDKLIQAATTPTIAFAASPQAAAPDYTTPAGWLARPGKASTANWTPPGFTAAPHPAAAVFYVAPTAFIDRARWNAPATDRITNDRLAMYLRAQASVWNGVGAIWAPFYRQATFGAFLKRSPDSIAALDLAYGDVARAWAAFLVANPAGPIMLAGHSQGSLHLQRLLAETIAGTPAEKRIVAVYIPGWPLSIEADLPALGLPACTAPTQTRCILTWMSFAEPADPRGFFGYVGTVPGWAHRPKAGGHNLCTNPIRGFGTDAPAVAAANLGALRPGATDADTPTLVPHVVGARCAGGVLLIGAAPVGFGRYIMSGNNYHVYDTSLFWANLRADAERRLDAFAAQNTGPR